MLALVSGGAAYGYWNWARPRAQLCEQPVLRWESMDCPAPVAESAQPHRAVTYRLTAERGRIVRVDRINGAGLLAADEAGEARWEFEPGLHGLVGTVVASDRAGNVRVRWAFSPDLKRVERRDRQDHPKPQEGAEVCVYQLDHDARGFRNRVVYHNVYGYPVADADRAFGMELDADASGRVTELRNLGEDGRPAVNRRGVLRETRQYDALGREVERSYWGQNGARGGGAARRGDHALDARRLGECAVGALLRCGGARGGA